MSKIFRAAPLALLLFSWPILADAAKIINQTPCGTGNAPCSSFTTNATYPRTLAAFTFVAPSAGRAQILLNGAMTCTSEQAAPKLVDLVTQIVNDDSLTPTANGPGGARHAMVVLSSPSGAADTVNLASSRVLELAAAGTQTVTFRVTKIQMATGITCDLHNMAFTAIVTP